MKTQKLLKLLAVLFLINCGSSTTKISPASNAVESTLDLTEADFFGDYAINSSAYGTITNVSLKDGNRVLTTNALPNHPTGSFPNPGNPNTISAQNRDYIIPLKPKLTGESKWAREPGVALNGVKFEPETAERFTCETGEVYRIEAVQELLDMGLDEHHAHVQPTGAYHYHGVPTGLIEQLSNNSDIVLVGFAKDGFPMYYSKSGKYKPSYVLSEELRTGDACSYKNPHQAMDKVLGHTQPDGTFVSDWVYSETQGQLDECNGITLDGNYVYFVTDEYPYIGRCLKGHFEEKHGHGPPRGGGGGPRGGEHRHGGHGHQHH